MNKKEYSVHELADLSGVSVRTLHYYDQIGLLSAQRKKNNYRSYCSSEVDRLHQILLYKELGMGLGVIKEALDQPDFDATKALEEHVAKLKEQRSRLDRLIAGAEKTLVHSEKGTKMTDEEKFEGFKKQLINENEQRYGSEIRKRYGDDEVDASNAKLMGLTKEQYENSQALAIEIRECLAQAMKEKDPGGRAAQKACDLHRQWLSYYWKEGVYNKQRHLGLGEMYVADDRFRAYYDQETPGTAELLRDALRIYCAE